MTPTSKIRHTTLLKQLVTSPKLLIMPAVFDAISARLVAQAGFPSVQCSGLSIAATSGVPDVGILSMREVVERTRMVINSVDIPVMGDADNGYGNAVNTWYTMREFELVGAAGANLEDQTFPKRCGRLPGKDLVSEYEMVLKIQTARDALRDDDFVINARTDALHLEGIEATINRSNAYLNAGATLVFIQGVSKEEQIVKLVSEIKGPIGINLIEGQPGTDELTFSKLEKLGIARVSLSTSLLTAAIHGMRQALQKIKEWDGTKADPTVFSPFENLHELAGIETVRQLEEQFAKQSEG